MAGQPYQPNIGQVQEYIEASKVKTIVGQGSRSLGQKKFKCHFNGMVTRGYSVMDGRIK